MKNGKSIIYVNYSPYENSGHILDYLLENFEHVFLIALGFYYLGTKQKSNNLTIYKQGNHVQSFSLYQIPLPQTFTFLFLPIRSFISFVQIVWWSIVLRLKYGPIDYFFSVNGFTAWTGNVLRFFEIVRKTVFWVWDYYPPIHKNKIITIMRSIYWQFDRWATNSNSLAFVNNRLLNLRKAMGLIAEGANYPIVPIGTETRTNNIVKKTKPPLVFGFIGVIKKSHGLGIVFDYAKEILKKFPEVRYEVIGSGPDEMFFRAEAKKRKLLTHFHGYVEDLKAKQILSHATICIATYVPDAGNVSHYGDPGKIKLYLSLGIPVIATNVISFANEIKKHGAGEIVAYNGKFEFIRAIEKILSHYPRYQKNALALSKKYNYKVIYKRLFAFDK